MRRCLPAFLKSARQLPAQPVFEKFVESLSPIGVDGRVTTTDAGGVGHPQQRLNEPQSPSTNAQRAREKKNFNSEMIASGLDEVGK